MVTVGGGDGTHEPRDGHQVSLDGGVEGREGGEPIIDGRRVRLGSRVKLKGQVPGFAAIPRGHVAAARRVREPGGKRRFE